MERYRLLVIGLLMSLPALSAFAKGAGNACSKASAGQEVCISGHQMKCMQVFSKETQSFRYIYFGVTAKGQAFDISSPFYMKLPGYTPRPCGSDVLSKGKEYSSNRS